MHADHLQHWTHRHHFDSGNPAAERGTWLVMWLSATMAVLEIAAGWWFNSMALLADGLHMSSHAVAIGLSAFAYALARRYAHDSRFAFGTWKIEVLAGFASAVFLLLTVLLMAGASIERLIWPQPIRYAEAIAVACLGLAVNVVSALILLRAQTDRHAGHGHTHRGGHGHDLNLRSAYLHVLADALTSVLAIVALTGGWILGLSWLDPVMGLAGAVVVALWARRLLLDTGRVLLDREMDHPVVAEIRSAVEDAGRAAAAKVTDLHVWRVGRASYACALTVVSHDRTLTPAQVRRWIGVHAEVVHATIELHLCEAC
jgi:cation diffusion facilitator family transporter